VPTPAPTSAPTPGYSPQNPELLQNSSAPLYTFYMYRAKNDKNYPPENVNTGDLAGVLWYLQHEVVIIWPPKFHITRIVRLKVQTRAPQPLADVGMNFGTRFAFDSGQCTGPYTRGHFDCQDTWAKYGYFVGCNNLGDWPYPKFDTQYPRGIWYSLPGVCPSMIWSNMTGECMGKEPGGACAGTPTGAGNCTYSYEAAGEITLAELQGDRGRSFWDDPLNNETNAWRVAEAASRFQSKYPSSPSDEDMQAPPCDFHFENFYSGELNIPW